MADTVTSLPQHQPQRPLGVVSVEERELVAVAEGQIHHVLAELGLEEERHAVAKATALEMLRAARLHHQTLIESLARKYTDRPGRFNYRPDLGAFERLEEKS